MSVAKCLSLAHQHVLQQKQIFERFPKVLSSDPIELILNRGALYIPSGYNSMHAPLAACALQADLASHSRALPSCLCCAMSRCAFVPTLILALRKLPRTSNVTANTCTQKIMHNYEKDCETVQHQGQNSARSSALLSLSTAQPDSPWSTHQITCISYQVSLR